MTLYAHWVQSGYVTITFNANGGDVSPTSRTVAADTAVEDFPTPTRPGFTFAGWWTTKAAGTKISSIARATSAQMFYAHWKATYTVMYRPGAYGTGAEQAATKTEGVALALKGAVFTRKNYKQTGWATSDGGAKAYGLGASYTANADLTLYPFWTANKYKLTLKPNSTKYGTVAGGGEYKLGATATLKAKAKTGYAFAGWFKEKSCKTALNPKGYDNRSPTVKYTMPAKNTTVYAKFVTKDAAKKSLKFNSATKKLAKTPAKATVGEAFSLKLGISSATITKVTAKGLPVGLSIDKTTGKITGFPTAFGSYTVKVTVKDAAGNEITQKVKMTVSVPSWAKGTFYGTAKPDGKTLSYLKFTVAPTGKVSGKVTYSGKAYSFTAKYKSCTATKATFAPKAKVGSKIFKPGTVTVETRKIGEVSLVEAANSKGTFAAQKTPGLVKKGKALAKLVGKSFVFTKKDAGSGLTKSADKLTVKLANGDAVTVSGTVGGKKLAALSWVTLVSGVEAASGAKVYTLYVDIIDAALKYKRTLTIKATVGSGGTTAEAFFGEAPLPSEVKVQLWEGGPYWATKYIGAEKPEDYGLYFWWGDTTGHRPSPSSGTFDFDFGFDNPAIYTFEKSLSQLEDDGWVTSNGVLAPEHDAAHVKWGGNWRMPTLQEMVALNDKCNWAWTTTNGVNGYVVRGRGAYSSNSIFLPCAGGGSSTSLGAVGSYGLYWSSDPISPNGYWGAGCLYFSSDYHVTSDGNFEDARSSGFSVRPVQGFAE